MHTIRLHACCVRPREGLSGVLDADAMAKWLPPNGFTGKVTTSMPGWRHAARCRSRTSPRDRGHSFGGSISKLVRTSASLHGQVRRREPAGGDAGHHHLGRVSVGTELNIVQEECPR